MKEPRRKRLRRRVRRFALGGAVALLLYAVFFLWGVWVEDPIGAGFRDLGSVPAEEIDRKITSDAATLVAVQEGLDRLERDMRVMMAEFDAGERDFYAQADNDAIREKLLAYLNYRTALYRILYYHGGFDTVADAGRRDRCLLLAYAAGLDLFHKGIVFVTAFEEEPEAIRKLNEGDPAWGIEAGVYDRIRERLTLRSTARHLARGKGAFDAVREGFARFSWSGEPPWPGFLARIDAVTADLEAKSFDVWGVRLDRFSADLGSGIHKPMAAVQTWISTAIGHVRISDRDGQPALISDAQIREILVPVLEPGDILLERRNWYLSNAFLPGFWSHAALYVGSTEEVEALGLREDPWVSRHWERFTEPHADGNVRCMIEAIGEGVIFNSLEDSAGADGVAVLRPRLTVEERARAVREAFRHAGKPYDFEFDFFSADRLVCTELVWRSYDGLLSFDLKEILGRRTLPAVEIAKTFRAARNRDDRPLDLVLFLDGDEGARTATVADEEAFCASCDRSSFTWLN